MSLLAQIQPLPTTPIQVNNAALTTAQIFPTVIGGTVALVLPIPGSSRLESDGIFVEATGWATVGGVSPTLNLVLYSGTSVTPGSNTVLATLAAAQALVTNATYDWRLKAQLYGSTKTGKISGKFSIDIDVNIGAETALTNQLTNQSFVIEPALSLVFGITFGVANAANVAQLSRAFAYINDRQV